MQERDPTQSRSKIPVGRRDFLKLTTIGAGVGTATAGSIAITGSAQAAPGEIKVRAKGGKINDFLLNSNTKFEVNWSNVSTRSNIYLFIQGYIKGEEDDNAAIMGNDRITAKDDGSEIVSVTDFTDREYFGVVAQNDLIDADDISVDLDNHDPEDFDESDPDPEPYTKKTSFDLELYGFHSASDALDQIDVRDVYRGRSRSNASNQNNGNGNADDSDDFGDDVNDNNVLGTIDPDADPLITTSTVTRSITVEAILGAGIHFGKEFGVTNSELPEGRV